MALRENKLTTIVVCRVLRQRQETRDKVYSVFTTVLGEVGSNRAFLCAQFYIVLVRYLDTYVPVCTRCVLAP